MLKFIEITWGKRPLGDYVVSRKGSYDGIKYKGISRQTCEFLVNEGYIKHYDFVRFFTREPNCKEVFKKRSKLVTHRFKIDESYKRKINNRPSADR